MFAFVRQFFLGPHSPLVSAALVTAALLQASVFFHAVTGWVMSDRERSFISHLECRVPAAAVPERQVTSNTRVQDSE